MPRIPTTQALALAAAGVLLLAAPGALASPKPLSKSETRFQNSGVQPEAEGEIELEARNGRSELEIEFEDLDPAFTYTLECDGTVWVTFDPDADGDFEIEFHANPKHPEVPMLPEDPRGASFVLTDGSQAVLTAVLAAEGESDDSRSFEKGVLDPAPGSQAKVRTRFKKKNGKARYQIKGRKLPAGSYALKVNGVTQAEREVGRNGLLKLRFTDPPKGRRALPLDFDPRGNVVELEGPGGLEASGDGSPDIDDLDECEESEVEVPLEAIAGVGEARSELEIDDDCDKSFEVEIEDVAPGPYDVWVDGVLRGTLQATSDGDDAEGEIEWETDPDDNELLLDFDPDGALIEVKQSDVVFFAGIQTPPATETGDEACEESEVEVSLIPTGALPDAEGSAELEVEDDCDREFEVEIEDVPAGTYDLSVGGVHRGTIEAVVDDDDDDAEGTIEFGDDDDQLPLDFDPRGALIEVFDGGTRILERTFPG